MALARAPDRPLRILELFAGTESLAKVARARGHEVVTLDISPRHNPTICADVLEWDMGVFSPEYFDYMHASCPCESYSRARTAGGERPLTQADALVRKTLEIFENFYAAQWTVENPATSLLWTRPIAQPLLAHVAKTSYCVYSAPEDRFAYRKNTWFAASWDIQLRSQCDGTGGCGSMIGRRHKEHAQKGGGGVESRWHTRDELHRIPAALCEDVLAQVENGARVEE